MMAGSPAVAAAAAQLGFCVLLALGAYYGELNRKSIHVRRALSDREFGLPRLTPFSGLYVTPWVAILDIALGLLVFRKDMALTARRGWLLTAR